MVLTLQSKDIDWLIRLKEKNQQLQVVYKKHTSLQRHTQTQGKRERIESNIPSNENQTQAGVNIFRFQISQTRLQTKISQNKECHYIWTKRTSHQEYTEYKFMSSKHCCNQYNKTKSNRHVLGYFIRCVSFTLFVHSTVDWHSGFSQFEAIASNVVSVVLHLVQCTCVHAQSRRSSGSQRMCVFSISSLSCVPLYVPNIMLVFE